MANEFIKYLSVDRFKDCPGDWRWGFFVISDNGYRKNRPYKNLLFEGNVYVLTNRKSFSAAMDFALMFVIAFNFISIFSEEIKTLKKSLKARNFKLNIKTFFKQGHEILLMFFANIFKRVDSLEMSLKARGYKN